MIYRLILGGMGPLPMTQQHTQLALYNFVVQLGPLKRTCTTLRQPITHQHQHLYWLTVSQKGR